MTLSLTLLFTSMLDIWNLPYTSEDLESLYNYCIPPSIPVSNGYITFNISGLNNPGFLENLKNCNFDKYNLPVLLIAYGHINPYEIACVTMPFEKVPLYIKKFINTSKKILEWRLQNGI